MIGQRGEAGYAAGVILAGAAAFAFLLALPGQTITASYVNDLFIFLDGAHRIVSGQVPNRDFHTALGPLSFYIPAAGYWLSGTMGGAMPYGMAAVTAALALPIAHILSSRLRPLIAIPYGLFLLLVLAVPTNFGESITALSFAMFYNRIGWAALSALLIMYLATKENSAKRELLDGICASVLILVMLYTKITYGLVAVAFLSLPLSDKEQRRWACISIGLTIAFALVVELAWKSTAAYISDLTLAGQVSGSLNIVYLVDAFIRHLADYTLLAIFATFVLWRTRSIRDLLFFGFCTVPGLIIQTQNSQPWGILTIYAGAVVAAEIIMRLNAEQFRADRSRMFLSAGSPLLLMALLLPVLLHCFMALGLHTTLALARSGEAFDFPQFKEIRLIAPWLSGKRTLMHAYLDSVEDGARLLKQLPIAPQKVAVLDFSNPFSAGLNLLPPRGDNAWLHWERNINASHFISPEQYFEDVEILMRPKWGINNIPLWDLYRTFVEENFEPLRDTASWTIYRRKSREVADKSSQ